jgi:hypothetical protein
MNTDAQDPSSTSHYSRTGPAINSAHYSVDATSQKSHAIT